MTTPSRRNSYGTGSSWNYTSMNSDGGCSYWQTFVNVYVSDLGYAYTTTGSPQFICMA